MKLSALTRQVQQAIESRFLFQTFWVMADVTNYSYQQAKQYHYFDLVEKSENGGSINAKISAAAWGAGNLRIKAFERITGQRFQNNIHVLVQVAVEYHAVYGLKLTVLDVDSHYTMGKLEQQRQLTLDRLLRECSGYIRKDGDQYITRNKELTLNRVIQRIAIVTSGVSAGMQDFQHTLAGNNFKYAFTVDTYLTTVQGESTELVAKLVEVREAGKMYDAVVIIRGGGAQSDFLVFDQYPLCQLVAGFPIPVITGIGHQKNETIADLLAHTSTKTPTKAAEVIIAHNRAFEIELLDFQKNIVIKSQQLFAQKFRGLSHLNQQLVSATRHLLYSKHRDVQNYSTTLQGAARASIDKQHTSIAHFRSVFQMMNPDNILKKGFAMIKVNGHIVTDPEKITVGEQVSVILSQTQLETVVSEKKPYDGNEFII